MDANSSPTAAERPDRVEEIRAKLAAITPGPWRVFPSLNVVFSAVIENPGEGWVVEGAWRTDADQAFTASAPEFVTYLLEDRERMQREIDALKAGLSWALDILDMYDKRLVVLGDPSERVYSSIYVAAKAKARATLSSPVRGTETDHA